MGLKETLQHDLTESMRAKDEIVMATIRLALTAITNEEVAGKEAKTLNEAEIIQVLSREAKKRRESAEAFDAAGRADDAARGCCARDGAKRALADRRGCFWHGWIFRHHGGGPRMGYGKRQDSEGEAAQGDGRKGWPQYRCALIP